MPIRQDTLRRRWLASNNYATSTRQTYSETLLDFERRYPVHAEQVRHEHLVDYLTTDASGASTTRAPSTLDRQRSTLRVFWRWARREGYVRADPADGLEHLRLGQGQRRQGRWLTRPEARQLLDACGLDDQGRRDHTLILLGLLVGLRRAELAGLTWRSVDLSQRRLTVQGKGGKLAVVGLPDQAATALRSWQAVSASRQGRRAPGPNQPVLPTGHQHGGLTHSLVDYVINWNQPLALWTVRAIVARTTMRWRGSTSP